MFEICSHLEANLSSNWKQSLFGSIFSLSLVFRVDQDDPYQKKEAKGYTCL